MTVEAIMEPFGRQRLTLDSGKLEITDAVSGYSNLVLMRFVEMEQYDERRTGKRKRGSYLSQIRKLLGH
jgi:hypothetical protein